MKKITDIMGSKYIVLVILTVTAFIIYYSSTNASFHFDDKGIVTGNASIEIEELSFSTLKMAALTKASGLRPVAYLTFAVNHYFSKGDTTSYHVVNIIIHIVNAFLIYLIIIRLFGAGDDERIRLSALFTALIWLAAPFNSQAVIYIVQRMTLLMTLFFLLAFLMYSIAKERGKKTYYVLCGLFFILSLLSKQNGITFPLVIVL